MKNKFLKKSLAMLVAATMAVSALPMFAGAADPVASTLTTDIGEKTFVVGEATEFTFTTKANDDAGIMVKGISNFSDASAIEKLEYYEINDGKWYDLVGDFGPVDGGFPLGDASARFRVTFKKAGNYSFTASMKKVDDGEVLCSTTADFTVKEAAVEIPVYSVKSAKIATGTAGISEDMLAAYQNNAAAVKITGTTGSAVNIEQIKELMAYENASKRKEGWFGVILTLQDDKGNPITINSMTGDKNYGVDAIDYTQVNNPGGTVGSDVVIWLSPESKGLTTVKFTVNGQPMEVTFNFKALSTGGGEQPDPVDPPVEKPAPEAPVNVAQGNDITITNAVIKGRENADGIAVKAEVPDTKVEGEAKTAYEAALKNGEVLGFYDIKLVDANGKEIKLAEGESLQLTLALGKEYANMDLVIRHYNSTTGAFVEEYKVKADAEGNVTFEVTSLSFFAVQKAAAKSSNPKTGDSTQIFVLLSVLAVAGASVVILRKRQLAK